MFGLPKDPQGQMVVICLAGGMAMTAFGMLRSILPLTFLGVLVAAIPGITLYLSLKRSGMTMFLEKQARGDVIVLYHAASGAIVPFKAKQMLERYLSLIGGYGRLRYTKRSTYWLFGRKVVHAIQGCAHTLPPWAVHFTNILKGKGYKSFGEAIVGEYGPELRGLTGLSREMAEKTLKKEGIPIGKPKVKAGKRKASSP